ncbi:MAG: sugar phosphate isomerase/epimerase [Fimbriimonadaceae bacterium]|jgi:hexulose-6-phosphate isomerase|nr:sugar phosphate isomerase/epimerase [Fimbriimonadaceae bacterium]
MIKSVNYWSYPGGLEGVLSPLDFLKMAHEDGFRAVEIGIGEPGSAFGYDASEEECRELRRQAEALGVPILSCASGLYWGRNLASETEEERDGAKSDLERMILVTHWLGAKTLLTIPGAVDVFFLPNRRVLDYDFVWNHATAGLRSLLPLLEETGVRLGIENVWNKFLLSPKEMAMFLDQFASPLIGSYLDVANILPYGYPDQWVRILGDKIVGVHFKDFRRSVGTADGFVDLLEGDVDWQAVVTALHQIGYDGPVPCEMIPTYARHPRVRVQNASRAMDAILGLAKT